ncbi:M20/M25/M40 family metallo-hydrolase [Niallia nealsonii]|uniref:Peptidase M20 n=1 Tax=Niallia nealsonii TaxID=115979 RepID=A0A2N0Z6Z9_9BACI|nr:M20/M25/M40 family metallo-hydrolase [Niallia nealsonii]PKG25289.1 peptidase M20 [Niallia nealsonii]
MILVEDFYQTVSQWTKKLVEIPSINGTVGEVTVMDEVERLLRTFPYFEKHPDRVWYKEIPGDPLGRKSVFGLVIGEKGYSTKTVLLHGHLDTVAIDDFGELKNYATDPEGLMEKMKELDLDEEVKMDLDSGDWYFGRGSVDMKSGVASHLSVLQYLSEHTSEFSGNVLFMANPIEETTHGGIIDALEELVRLKKEQHFEYITAINADFIGPLYPGDRTKYIYLGSVGKLLPSFYIRGKETHVGQPFEGLDPNLIASELVRRINYNMSLADEAEGETTLPPVTLKLEDLKKSYNVQTPFSSFVYFNYFVHKITPSEVISQLLEIALDAFKDVIADLNRQYTKYCEVLNRETESLPWKPRVITYEELYTKVMKDSGEMVNERLQEVLDKNKREDLRIVSRMLVDELLKMDADHTPVIVLFFSAPYVPHNYAKDMKEHDQKWLKQLDSLAQEIGEKNNETFQIKKFFPSLTDSSYLSMDDSDKDIETIKSNFPGMDVLYPVPVKTIKSLDIPAINLGVWGKDAHKWTERVYKPFSFQILPELITKFTLSLLD